MGCSRFTPFTNMCVCVCVWVGIYNQTRDLKQKKTIGSPVGKGPQLDSVYKTIGCRCQKVTKHSNRGLPTKGTIGPRLSVQRVERGWGGVQDWRSLHTWVCVCVTRRETVYIVQQSLRVSMGITKNQMLFVGSTLFISIDQTGIPLHVGSIRCGAFSWRQSEHTDRNVTLLHYWGPLMVFFL